MPKATSPRQPKYRKHKATGQAVVTLDGKDIYLGKHGTASSKQRYATVIAEWLAGGQQLPPCVPLTITELVDRFWQHVEKHYRKNGSPTSEVGEYRLSLRPLRHLYGSTPAKDFNPIAFKAVRLLMVQGYEHPRFGAQRPLCRRVVNHRMERIKRLFRWATEEMLVPASVYHSLLAVRGLQRGRSDARETEPVRPVPEAHVHAIRPYVSRQVRGLIDLQLLTGARPGELCIMRGCDLNTTGRIWIFIPESHKTEHHGHRREIYLGPKAQEVVREFLKPDLQAYLFSPRDAEADRLRVMRENRRSPVQPSQFCRKRKHPKKTVGDYYDGNAYRRAITYGCAKAFPLPDELAPRIKADGTRESKKEWKARLTVDEKAAIRQWHREHDWHPHQLRHNALTNLRREYGVELARIVLGHKTAFTTEIYAEVDRAQAMEVISKIG
jgi:integrase